MLNVIDNQWKDHLLSMDHLKEGIGLRGYGQKDPLVEYKKESYELFQDMMDRIEDETIRYLFFLQVQHERAPACCRSRTKTRKRTTRRSRSGRARRRASSSGRPRKTHDEGLHAQHPAQERKGTGGPAVRRRRRLARHAAGGQRRRRSAATIPAPAAAARNTRSATDPRDRGGRIRRFSAVPSPSCRRGWLRRRLRRQYPRVGAEADCDLGPMFDWMAVLA